MNRRWNDTQPQDEDGVFPPCPYMEDDWDQVCGDPVAVDEAGFTYTVCPAHLLVVSEPNEATS